MGSGGSDGWVAQLYQGLSYESITPGLSFGGVDLGRTPGAPPAGPATMDSYALSLSVSGCDLQVLEGIPLSRAFLRKLPTFEARSAEAAGGSLTDPPGLAWEVFAAASLLSLAWAARRRG